MEKTSRKITTSLAALQMRGFVHSSVTVDFLFVLIELFLLGVTAEALRANIDWKSAFMKEVGQFRPNFHVEWDVPRTIFSRIKRPVNSLQL